MVPYNINGHILNMHIIIYGNDITGTPFVSHNATKPNIISDFYNKVYL